MAPTTQFEVAQPPSDAVSRVVFAPDSSTRLLVSSWDKNVYLYEIDDGDAASATLVKQFEHRAPVLDVCFGASDNEAFTAGLDHRVTRIDLTTGEQTTISEHTKPVRCIVYSPTHQILVSASWDSTLHFHNLAAPAGSSPAIYTLPGKPHAMSASPTKVVVAMTARLVHIFDLPTIAAQFSSSGSSDNFTIDTWQKRESSLKFLTRAVACMPNDAGYATSSIEGRVAVEWFEDTAESQARKYAFKCHRQANAEEDGGGDVVYPVNALVFHPVFGKTFASGGGDGTVALWDAEAKRRMKQYQNFGNSVASLAFSKNGKYMAAGVCPGFETGQEDYSGAGLTKVVIRELSETEAKGKGAK